MPIPLTATDHVDFTPPAILPRNIELMKAGKTPIKLRLRVPTMYERDSFSAAMVRGGVIHYSRQQIRDLMLAGVVFLYGEEKFEAIRTDLEGLWQMADAVKEAELKRTEFYLETMERQAELPPEKHLTEQEFEAALQAIQPDVQLDEATRVRVTAIQQDVTARYEPLQKAFADLAEQDIRRNWLCAEIYVAGWEGLAHQPDGNGKGGITRREAEWLRGQIGKDAFDQLGAFVLAMHSLDEDEEKNLASLIESSSAPIGSTLAESMASSEPGNSTVEPSTEIPDTGSPETIASSSSSTNPSKTKTGRSGRSRTAKRSSTSPSS